VGTADDKKNRADRITDRLKTRLCRINGNVRGKQATVSDTGIFRLIARPRREIATLYDMRAALVYGNPSASKCSEIASRSIIAQKNTRFFGVYIAIC